MKYYEFVVTKTLVSNPDAEPFMVDVYQSKKKAVAAANRIREDESSKSVEITAHVYGLPLDDYNCPDSYLYSYAVEF